jgi:ribosomal protein S18 acetylase RimI-like enzyme
MRRATMFDKENVINILVKSFEDEPHTSMLLRNSKNPKKLEKMMEYIFDETLCKGEIYINDDNTAVAIWDSELKEKDTWKRIKRDMKFLKDIGFLSCRKCVLMERIISAKYPPKYYHLYLIGVLPEHQGKGEASKLMNYMIERMQFKKIPIYLETAKLKNVEIYKKKGFREYDTINREDINLHLMRIDI